MRQRSKQVLSEVSRTRRWFALLALAMASAVVWLCLRGRAEPRARGAIAESSRAKVPAGEKSVRRVLPVAPLAQRPAEERLPGPRIERIDVDKTEVCYGEENFATVRAFDASGASDGLIVRLSGSREMGFRVPFRIEKSDATRTRHVIVTGGGGPPAVAAIPEVKVKNCEVAEQVTLGVRLQERSPHVLVLTADVASTASGAAEKLEPVSYEWDFGDGTSQTTEGSEVVHSYEGQPATTRFSYFLLRVKVKDRNGREVTGSRAYGFPNFGFGTFVDNHQVLLHSAGGSLAGEQAAAGERVRLYHGYEGIVNLERVRSTELSRAENRELPAVEHSAAALLGVSQLSPGKSTETSDLASLRPTEPGRIRKLELIGRAGSIEARGTIVLTSTAASEASPNLHAMEEAVSDLAELPQP
jgi:hypothetical protein